MCVALGAGVHTRVFLLYVFRLYKHTPIAAFKHMHYFISNIYASDYENTRSCACTHNCMFLCVCVFVCVRALAQTCGCILHACAHTYTYQV